jgi:AP-1 complex subunit mu
MGLSSLYILDQKGRVLISRAYRADVPYNAHEIFQKKLLEYDEVTLKPFIFDDDSKIAFFHIRHQNLIIVATACRDVNTLMVFTFLHKLVDVLKSYLKEVVEESVRDNFVIIYELLDEMMDNGFPQHTDHELLKEYIKSDYHQMSEKEKKAINIPENVNNVVTWRKSGINHKKNEVYMDVIEKLNMTVTSGGQVIKSEVIGR